MNIKELQKEYESKLSDLRRQNSNLNEEDSLLQEAKLNDLYQPLFLSADYDSGLYSDLSIFKQICIAAGIRRPENVQARI